MRMWRTVAAAFLITLTALPVLAADTGSGTGTAKLNWFGSIRIRPEYDDNLYDVSSTQGEDNITYTSYRVRLGVKAELDNNISAVIESQYMGKFGEDQTAIRGSQTWSNTGSTAQLFQAYIDAKNIAGQPVSVRAGRQTLVLADGWLMGNLDFYGGTSWDGVRVDVDHKRGTFTGFYMKEAELDSPELMAAYGAPRGLGYSDMYGLWSTWKLAKKMNLEAGILYHNDHNSQYLPGHPLYRDKRMTYTANFRYEDKTGPFAVVNAAWQRGTGLNSSYTDYADIDAKAWEVTAGWKFEVEGNPNKVYARVAQYGGDKPSTEKNETFDPLYMDFHGRYGLSDFWSGAWGRPAYLGGPYGAYFLQLGFESQLPGGLKLGAMFQNVRRDQRFEVENRNLGTEFSVAAGYDYGKNHTLNVGFAQVYPGPAIDPELPQPPKSNPTKRIFVSTTVHF